MTGEIRHGPWDVGPTAAAAPDRRRLPRLLTLGRRPPEFSSDTAPRTEAEPSLALQVNALQALCRQVFGFRLAMIAVASPLAIERARPGIPTWLVCGAVVVTFMVSYLLFRDWERFGPLLLRYPAVLAADMMLSGLLLVTATTQSTLAYVCVCGPLLGGLAYGWRSAAVLAAFQSLIVAVAYAVEERAGLADTLLLPGFCVIAGAVGVSLRNLMLRFGVASHALTETRARLAVREAIEAEQSRLARHMHDSVAKSLHGVALAADGLAASAGRKDTETVRDQAELVSRAARRAAAESRELLSDLRRDSGTDGSVQVAAELQARTADVGRRTGLRATFRVLGDAELPPVPHAVARQLFTIVSEALENAHRHARPQEIAVTASVVRSALRISVIDDGRGLPTGTSLEELRNAGHFGLVGMVERAVGVGARIRIGRGHAAHGTEVRLDLPLTALTPRRGCEPHETPGDPAAAR
jgi:signal transduction histidine kinase